MSRRQGDSSNLSTAGSAALTQKVPTELLREYLGDWVMDAKVKGHTVQSMKSRQARIGKFFWFLEHKSYEAVGAAELKEFLLYLQEAHTSSGGRWCNPRLRKPMRPIMVGNYHRIVKAFFNFLIEEELIDFDPMRRVKVAKEKTEIKAPVSPDDFRKLLNAARKTEQPRRDAAILWTLWDSGVRASELSHLTKADFDESNLSIHVLGKGNKYRTVYLTVDTAKAIRAYLRHSQPRRDSQPLFSSRTNKPLSACGLYQVMQRLSKSAGIDNPGIHAFRRSFAVKQFRRKHAAERRQRVQCSNSDGIR